MNFNVGAQQTPQQQQQGSTGFGFGTPAPILQQPTKGIQFVTAPSSGFAFGAPATSASNFAFGAAPQNTTSGYAFGAPATTTNSGSFAFGSSAPTGGFNFGAPAASTHAQQNPGFSFGAPQTTTSSVFSFGAPTTTPSFSFNVAPITTSSLSGTFPYNSTPASAPSFSFGTPATTSNTMAFGTMAASTPSTGISFGAVSSTTTPNSGFVGFGVPPSSTTSTPGTFGFGNTVPSVSLSMPITQAAAPAGGFAFGIAPVTTTSAPSSMFNFGNSAAPGTGTPTLSFGTPQTIATTTAAAAPISGFGFGQPAQSTGFPFSVSAAQTTVAAPSIGGFQFGTAAPASTVLDFGQIQPAAVTVPATTTISGFSFGLSTSTPASTNILGTGLKSSTAAPLTATSLGFAPAANAAGDTAINLSTTAIPVISSIPASAGFAVPQIKPTQPAPGSLFPTSTMSTTSSAIGASTDAQAKTIAFGFGTPVTSTPSAGFAFGLSTTTAATTGFSTAPILGKTTTSTSLFPASTTLTTSAPSLLMFGDSATSLPATSVPASSVAAILTTTTTVTPASAAAPATINFRQLEDTINKWKIELDEQEKVFLNQSTQVNAWDRLLITNAEKITELNDAEERVKLDQQRLDHELEFIVAQQTELEQAITVLEKNSESLNSINSQQHADLEREHTFHLAENINAQLRRMSDDIKEIIEHLNTANKAQDRNDPIQQIAKILNAHMDALQWIDINTVTLQRHLEATAKICDTQRKELDRPFRGQFGS